MPPPDPVAGDSAAAAGEDAWAEWQRALAAALMPDADDGSVDRALALTRGNRQTMARRLGRWRGGRAVLHEDVLAHAYPAVRRAMGQTAFQALAAAYTVRHPSRNGDLAHFGARLPAFLLHDAAMRPWRALCEVARLEWAVHRLHGAVDAPSLEARDAAALSPEALGRLAVRLHPACRVLALRRGALDCWNARHGEAAPDEHAFEGGPDTAVLVYRRRYRIAVREVGVPERAALRRLRRGCSLAAALEAAAMHLEDMAAAGALFARWLDDGVLLAMG